MIGIAVTIGVMVIFQAMYAAVMERTREISILKSLGVSKAYLVNAILRETTLLAIGGLIVGIANGFPETDNFAGSNHSGMQQSSPPLVRWTPSIPRSRLRRNTPLTRWRTSKTAFRFCLT
jgi:hypothetical protein